MAMGVEDRTEHIVLMEGLTKKFGNVIAVDDLNLQVSKGEIFGLLGSDGAGKTTTIQMLCGIVASSSGCIFVDGNNVEKEPDAVRSAIGYMSQDFTLYLDMTVEENIDFIADLSGVPMTDRDRQKERLLFFSRMKPFRNRRAGLLSGGMKKKLALSCALIHVPKVLVLDEPTTAVDPLSRTELWRILYEFIAHGITVIISTPYMDEAERCHRVAMMEEGKIIACDTPTNLKKILNKKVFAFKPDNINQACKVLRDNFSVFGQVYGDSIRLFTDNIDFIYPEMRNKMEENGIIAGEYSDVAPTMDDVFVSLLRGGARNANDKYFVSLKSSYGNAKSIIVSEITKKYGDFTAVGNVSFEVKKGTVLGLLGPNGAGKTTVIKMLCGLFPPTAGRAEVAGYDIATHPRQVKGKIGYMSQLFSLYQDLTVEQNLDFYGSIYGLGRKEKAIKKKWIIELAGLHGKEKYLVSEFSGGWKQKLALGCAVMSQPAVLFLDEPTSGVDPLGRADFWDVIYRFAEDGITSIVTTHFMDEAERCNILGMMNEGRLVAFGTPEELKKSLPSNFYEISASSVIETYSALIDRDYIDQVALFGDKIHVMTNKGEEYIRDILQGISISIDNISRIPPSLEDVFVYHVTVGRKENS